MTADTIDPAVRCSGCAFAWNSDAMVEGLRLVAGCPRCGERLEFRDEDAPPAPHAVVVAPASSASGDGDAPHLVLGIPRRPGA